MATTDRTGDWGPGDTYPQNPSFLAIDCYLALAQTSLLVTAKTKNAMYKRNGPRLEAIRRARIALGHKAMALIKVGHRPNAELCARLGCSRAQLYRAMNDAAAEAGHLPPSVDPLFL